MEKSCDPSSLRLVWRGRAAVVLFQEWRFAQDCWRLGGKPPHSASVRQHSSASSSSVLHTQP